MKIRGEKVFVREVVEVEICRADASRSLKLKVCGVPVGFHREYEAMFPKPQPPSTTINRAGKDPEVKKNWDDPKYVALYEEWAFLEKFYTLYHCLAVDTSVSFESKADSPDALRALVKEFKDAGFSEGDVGQIIEAINKATVISPKAIEEAKADFA